MIAMLGKENPSKTLCPSRLDVSDTTHADYGAIGSMVHENSLLCTEKVPKLLRPEQLVQTL